MIIGFENLAESATLTASEEAAGFDVENLVDYRLDDWWKATSTTITTVVTVDFDLGSAQSVDYFAIVGHNFASALVSYKLQRDDNAGYASPTDVVGATVPSSDGVHVKTFSSASDRYWRLRMTMLSTTPPIIAHLNLGARWDVPVGPRAGFVPPKHGIQHKYINNLGDSGLFLGRSLIREQNTTEINLTNLTAAQVFGTDVEALITHALAKPFFLLWDETNYPTQAAYCHLVGEPDIGSDSTLYWHVRLPVGAQL